MKKSILTALTISFLFFTSSAQTSFTYLTAGNSKAQVNNNGMLFNDTDSDNVGFEIPKGSGLSTIFSSSLWIGGLDQDDKLHLAAQTYGQSGDDYYRGPIDKNGDAVDPTNWDLLYKVSTEEIELHKISYDKPGYEMPYGIENWPVDLGDDFEGVYNKYFDFNNNSIYDPENGDYPIIMGNEEAYFIMNDYFSIHGESNAAQLGVEIRVHAFVFNDDEIGNSVFARFEIVNKSANNYHDVYAGIFADFDLGEYTDDVVGSDATNNMFYAYNANPIDANYGNKPPAQAVVFLNHTLDYSVYYNNDYSKTGNPQDGFDYYYYLSGKDKDGAAFFNKLAYPGDPCTNTGTLQNGQGDRRMVGSTGAFNLNAGETFILDIAYVFAQGTSNTNSVCELQNRTRTVRQLYNNGAITSIKNTDAPNYEITVYPNPTTSSTTIKFFNPEHEAFEVEVFSAVGKLVYMQGDIYENEVKIDAIVLPRGIYYVKVRKKSDTVPNNQNTVKLIVQ